MSDKATLQRLLRELIYETSIERRTIILTQIVSLFDAVREEPACEADILRAELAAARADADRLAEANRWIPVDEQMPDLEGSHSSGQVLMGERFLVAQGMYSALTQKWYYSNGNPVSWTVTHWRPLPEPPAHEGKGEGA